MPVDGPRASPPPTAAGPEKALAGCVDPAWLIDPAKGRVLAANAAGAARLGLRPDAASGTLDAAMPALVRLRAMLREPQSGGSARAAGLLDRLRRRKPSVRCCGRAGGFGIARGAHAGLDRLGAGQAADGGGRRRRTRSVTAAAQRAAVGRGRRNDDQDRPRHPQRLCRRARRSSAARRRCRRRRRAAARRPRHCRFPSWRTSCARP